MPYDEIHDSAVESTRRLNGLATSFPPPRVGPGCSEEILEEGLRFLTLAHQLAARGQRACTNTSKKYVEPPPSASLGGPLTRFTAAGVFRDRLHRNTLQQSVAFNMCSCVQTFCSPKYLISAASSPIRPTAPAPIPGSIVRDSESVRVATRCSKDLEDLGHSCPLSA